MKKKEKAFSLIGLADKFIMGTDITRININSRILTAQRSGIPLFFIGLAQEDTAVKSWSSNGVYFLIFNDFRAAYILLK